MRKEINKKAKKQVDKLANAVIEDIRRTFAIGISSQELIQIFVEGKVKINISPLEKMSEKTKEIVFKKASEILAENGICIKYTKNDELNCQFSLIEDFPTMEPWYKFEDDRIILEKGHLIVSGRRAFEKITEELVSEIKHSILASDTDPLALYLKEPVYTKRSSFLYSVKSTVAREKIILAATQRFEEEGEITVEFEECKGKDEEGRYDCTICMIDDVS